MRGDDAALASRARSATAVGERVSDIGAAPPRRTRGASWRAAASCGSECDTAVSRGRYGMHAIIDRRHFLNRFWREEIDVEFSERIFKIAIGMNKLTLAVADIDRLTRHDDYYSIYHDCGLFLILPKRFLTGEEITLLDSYKSMVDKRDRGKKFYNFLLSRYQRVTPDDKEH